MENFPEEIINNIIDYRLSYLYSIQFKELLEEIPLRSAFMKIKYIQTIYKSDLSQDYLDLLLELTTKDERLLFMKILNSCKCCKNHQKRKPSVEQYLSGFVPSYSTKKQKIKNCKCLCRSFSRDICRAENDEIDQSL